MSHVLDLLVVALSLATVNKKLDWEMSPESCSLIYWWRAAMCPVLSICKIKDMPSDTCGARAPKWRRPGRFTAQEQDHFLQTSLTETSCAVSTTVRQSHCTLCYWWFMKCMRWCWHNWMGLIFCFLCEEPHQQVVHELSAGFWLFMNSNRKIIHTRNESQCF